MMKNQFNFWIITLAMTIASLCGYVENIYSWSALPVKVNDVWYSLYDQNETQLSNDGTTTYEHDVYPPCSCRVDADFKCNTNYVYNEKVFYGYKNDGVTLIDNGVGINDNTRINNKLFHSYFGSCSSNASFLYDMTHLTISLDLTKKSLDASKCSGGSIQNITAILVPHLRLYDGSDVGVTSLSYNFGDQTVSTSSDYHYFYFRSFLTEANTNAISVSFTSGSSDFSVEATSISVPGNSCGVYGNGNNERINTEQKEYAIGVKFNPSSAGAKSGTITITNGSSSVTITVSGNGMSSCNAWTLASSQWYVYTVSKSYGSAQDYNESIYLPNVANILNSSSSYVLYGPQSGWVSVK